MFTWKDLWRKPETALRSPSPIDDQMEQALWEIKDMYDFETEEIDRVVSQKRTNIKKMKSRIKNKQLLFTQLDTYFRGQYSEDIHCILQR